MKDDDDDVDEAGWRPSAYDAEKDAAAAAAPKKKRKKTTSPTARSLAECRKRGWTAQVVEKWNMHAKVLQDLFGCIDIVAITPDGILGIQATSDNTGGNAYRRVEKILAEPRAKKWIEAGGKLHVWSWAKRGGLGKRKLWELRTQVIDLEAFVAAEKAQAAA